MKSKSIEIENYLSNLYLPMYFLKFCNESSTIVFNADNVELPTNNKLTSKDISKYISSNLDKIKMLAYNQFLTEISKPIYFTLDELIEIQSSSEPFTSEEIEDIMDTELERENYLDINCVVVEFCVDWLLKHLK